LLTTDHRLPRMRGQLVQSDANHTFFSSTTTVTSAGGLGTRRGGLASFRGPPLPCGLRTGIGAWWGPRGRGPRAVRRSASPPSFAWVRAPPSSGSGFACGSDDGGGSDTPPGPPPCSKACAANLHDSGSYQPLITSCIWERQRRSHSTESPARAAAQQGSQSRCPIKKSSRRSCGTSGQVRLPPSPLTFATRAQVHARYHPSSRHRARRFQPTSRRWIDVGRG